MTQEKLAEYVDIHPRQMSKIETGEHFPSCKTLEKICVALDVTPSFLFDFIFDNSELNSNKNSKTKNNNEKLYFKILNNLTKYVDDEQSLKFICLSIKALSCKKSLELLEYTVHGMGLSTRSKLD